MAEGETPRNDSCGCVIFDSKTCSFVNDILLYLRRKAEKLITGLIKTPKRIPKMTFPSVEFSSCYLVAGGKFVIYSSNSRNHDYISDQQKIIPKREGNGRISRKIAGRW